MRYECYTPTPRNLQVFEKLGGLKTVRLTFQKPFLHQRSPRAERSTIMRLHFFTVLLLLIGLPVTAQIPDTIDVDALQPRDFDELPDEPLLVETGDTTLNLSRRELRLQRRAEQGWPNPKRAFLLSLIFPGAGQIYNGQWWKTPFVYGAVGGATYNIIYNRQQYVTFRELYRAKVAGETLPAPFAGSRIDNEESLRRFRNSFDKKVQEGVLLVVAAYGLQALEAFVAAHLKDFDVSDDLGFRLEPDFTPTAVGTPTFGLGVRIPIR